jgi:bis(5'-nucleosyl)-tetraphosphatase (symmetrical)
MARRIFIGDIQGCRVELETLLERLRFDPAADALHPVGDLVNRGPDSLGTLRLLKRLGAASVLGNHELHLLQCAAGLRAEKSGDTLAELLAADDRDELLAWVRAQPFVRVAPDVYQIHAGLHPAWRDPAAELAGADPLHPTPAARFAVRARYSDAKGNLPQHDGAPPGAPFVPWHQLYRPERHGGRTVVFGHWATQGLLQRPHLRGLDTGCVWGKELTAWIAEEDRVVSVRARRAYAVIGRD